MRSPGWLFRPAASLLLVAPTVLFAPRSQAQAAGAEQPQTVQPNNITIDVVASDKLGHPVRGLGLQDFTVLDNGQAVKLTGFRAVDSSTDPDAVRVVLVFDEINNDLSVVARVREQMGEFLKQDGGKLGYPTAIAAMTETGVQMMNGYSQDGNVMLASFQKLPSSIRLVGRDAGFYGAAERVEDSLRCLDQVISYEAAQPGRKLVLIVGPGWPMLSFAGVEETDRQLEWNFNTIVRLTNIMRESHIALYSVDPFFLGRTDPFYYQGYLKPVKKVNQAEYPYLAQQVLAEHSGGRALTEGTDIVGGINTALHDAGAYYELTFEAPAPDKANEFHALQVKTDKPGVTVRTNAGYYAQPEPLGGKKTTPPSKVPAPGIR